jgi:hypothetical protein
MRKPFDLSEKLPTAIEFVEILIEKVGSEKPKKKGLQSFCYMP